MTSVTDFVNSKTSRINCVWSRGHEDAIRFHNCCFSW